MSEQAPVAETTPLEERLIDLIKLKGPITIADYMSDALGHPHEGYYMSRTPIGGDGDFTTAPEISQVFGELIGLWLIETWQAMGAPKNFNLIELGPGRGVLMEDMLRAARLRPGFAKAAQVWLLETSGRLRLEQQKRLKATEAKPLWADEYADISPAPSLIIANEFFDCLPVRQFERVEAGWRERLVGLDESKTELAFTLAETPPPSDFDLPDLTDSDVGDVFELNLPAQEFVSHICATLKEHGGHALIIDYGHMERGFGDTLQAVRDHRYWPPLSSPGRADLTAHVDFEALATIAIEDGVTAHGPVTQGRFLDRLGLTLRVEALCKGQDEKRAEEIRNGAMRIASPQGMGEIFKVMCLSSPSLPTPAGFET
ncbi:class I SAM-dependent methyltransferase [Hyphococcus flavus]|uniref:Class I SAM-dependent methyltransferase n=1 Tax=Hyphococcus flavus TaxID=1866326 RepID=A0AAE9ZAZ8_9PROT|nr:class I SAM-dependent methyltransferase [Hyphococcus flavus]WDI30586.1 class I SAM-dependent methyltransferase [Hyphococcus flavus]